MKQKNGFFVASVAEGPGIIVYDKSRKMAEQKATKEFLRMPDPHAWTVPVPVHGSRTLPKGTLASIIRMAGVTRKRFFENL